MNPLILFAIVALLVGLGGGVGFRMVTAPKPKPAAHPTAVADSVAAAAHGATPAPAPPAPPSTAPIPTATPAKPGEAAPADPAHPVAAPPPASTVAHALPAAAPAPPIATVAATALPDVADPARYKQVASILLSMKPAEAAKIMAYLSDRDVEGILRGLAGRQAATLVAQLPTARAAAISQRLMDHAKAGTP